MARKTIASLEKELAEEQKKNATLKQNIEVWASKDEDIREEITKIFFPQNQTDGYGYAPKKHEALTWPQIFFEIGKIINKADYLNLAIYEQNIDGRVRVIEDSLKRKNGGTA